jgi:hypothetical protein
LLSVEASQAAESTSRILAAGSGRLLATGQPNFAKMKADLEATPALFYLRITELEKKSDRLAEDLSDIRLAQKNLSKVVAEKDGYIEELEANNEKNLQRLALQK